MLDLADGQRVAVIACVSSLSVTLSKIYWNASTGERPTKKSMGACFFLSIDTVIIDLQDQEAGKWEGHRCPWFDCTVLWRTMKSSPLPVLSLITTLDAGWTRYGLIPIQLQGTKSLFLSSDVRCCNRPGVSRILTLSDVLRKSFLAGAQMATKVKSRDRSIHDTKIWLCRCSWALLTPHPSVMPTEWLAMAYGRSRPSPLH